MTAFSNREVRQALHKKGFRTAQRDHQYFFFYVGGQKTAIFTFVSHSRNVSYSDSLLDCMAKELHLSKRELCRLLSCTFTRLQYVERLIDHGILGPECLAAVASEK